jgi:hypothetical protein
MRRLYLLRGLIHCGLCGTLFGGSGKRSAGRYYYQCGSQRKDRHAVHCGNRSVRAEQLETAVWDNIRKFVSSPGKVLRLLEHKLHKSSTSNRDIAHRETTILKALASKQRERDHIITLGRRGLITEAEEESQLRQLKAEMDVLERERDEMLNRERAMVGAKSRLKTAQSLLETLSRQIDNLARCLVPQCDGVTCPSLFAKEALWDNFYTAAPARLRHCVERYNIVKKA